MISVVIKEAFPKAQAKQQIFKTLKKNTYQTRHVKDVPDDVITYTIKIAGGPLHWTQKI